MTTTPQVYRYLRPSTIASGRLGLATSGGVTTQGAAANPDFFTGFLQHPETAATGLLATAAVARARYFQPGLASLRDPVVTCDGDGLRFESFSSCGGVYARFDVASAALDGEMRDRGTTNVDFNAALCEALAKVGGRDPLRLNVGAEELSVTTTDTKVTEKKVPLPQRWLRGFAEVQVITPRFDLRAELSAPEATRFLRSLPTGEQAADIVWLSVAGRGLRRTSRPAPGAVCLAGPSRLETLRPLLRFAKSLRVYGPPVTHSAPPTASAWELVLPDMRLMLTLSPEPRRGFSGEGAVLDALIDDAVESDAELIGNLLDFRPYIDIAVLADTSGLSPQRVRAALTQLGTAGRVGYDVANASFFHRELPYDADKVEQLNPRLRNARALARSGAVHITGDIANVTSRDKRYQVRLDADGLPAGCTCRWWAEHRGERGKCKHVLAVHMSLNGSDES
ncbi:SWIM zinc finger family protein [Stackebrandtia nassauensis]|uniref:Zinc finger SWIM domain protein n=1 Tax=Stackebrandtia nassauensis (strain DSM 44728 / CIP 108903 / NRRL B-16338 / NBRC 102104 / LLR-40K-21) TaxID=446470 RepID=D3Q682_STANL|nr:SWIM zinc finger family protein [Stackebrandtia nassauensis]ADD42257.1 zinc finger SWIM domain protein [Stackebrandtia nassauensis DSM 44728]